ncbi:MAG: NADH-quinone oxidoreductase subunit C [Fibrobacter sp.]|nr:NADH-quinone oxidoreductase subunit C [Fibrobacter sp.]MCQ2120956.1 NADH-quinone oxidoreductase subunit C [Fibrobacter sp.]
MDLAENIFPILEERFAAKRELKDKWGLTVVVSKTYLHPVVEFLKNEAPVKMEMLVDIAGVDFLGYKDYEGPRFAVKYVFKSISQPGARMQLKVFVSEDDLTVPTISDLYGIANWQEREVYDQFGVVFKGHPDLRRILNHVEFVGHPLRKDYPAQKRQWLSTNDFMLPELEKRLETLGYKVIQRSKEVGTNDNEFLEGSIKG